MRKRVKSVRRKQRADRNNRAVGRSIAHAWSEQALKLLVVAVGTGLPCAYAQVPPNVGLPNQCVAGTCGGRAFDPMRAISSVVAAPNSLTINQQNGTAILNWRDFNISNGNLVRFVQPDAASVALNRIHDARISTIDGRLQANGQVYLINPNGILFGANARVDVGALIASTLNMSDSRVLRGLLSDPALNRAALGGDAAFNDGLSASERFDNLPARPGNVTIDQGAVLHAASRLLAFGGNVSNAGSIVVGPGGQVVLAAGERVYIAQSNDATLRGLLVEVGNGGQAGNAGTIDVARGNASIIGLAVNQSGRVSATSALRENGSVRLIAREVSRDGSVPSIRGDNVPQLFATPTATGAVTVASGSRTEVVLDRTDTAVAPLLDEFAAAAKSAIRIEGESVSIGGAGAPNSTVLQARGGSISVAAGAASGLYGSSGQLLGSENAIAKITIGGDARIDVSGERDVLIDGARNFVFIDRLTSSDLRDAPLQRDGFLRGKGVFVNVGVDHPFIDFSNRRASLSGTQAERNAVAGNITLRAEGAVDIARGATLDVAGGSTRTTDAVGRTSQLITENGQVVDIMRASADTRYVGFADSVSRLLNAPREGVNEVRGGDAPRFSFVPGFTEGKSAGAVELYAPRGTIAGDINGPVVRGPQQRAASPLGATLRVGTTATTNEYEIEAGISRGHVLLASDPSSTEGLLTEDERQRAFVIDSTMLRRGNVQRVRIISDGRIVVADGSPLDVGAGGEVTLRGNALDIRSSVSAAAGTIALTERPLSASDVDGTRRDSRNLVAADQRGKIGFARGVELNAAGTFSNDALVAPLATPSSPLNLNGGTVTVSGRSVDLSNVSAIEVGAGAQLRRNGTIVGGRAGTITLAGTFVQPNTGAFVDSGVLNLGTNFGQRVNGTGFTGGGTIALTAPSIRISPTAPAAGSNITLLSEDFFAGGFQTFSLTGNNGVTIDAGARITPVVAQYETADALQALRFAPDGTDIASTLQAAVLPAPLRQPVTINLRTLAEPEGAIRIGSGALVDAGLGGRISMTAGARIDVDGTLRAQGGAVDLRLAAGRLALDSVATFEQRAIRLAPNATIDVSGASKVETNAAGQRRGDVLAGGSVTIDAVHGYVAIDQGARVDARGAADMVDVVTGNRAQRTDVASAGGAVALRAQQGLFIEGAIAGAGGASHSDGGRLSVQFTGLTTNEKLVGTTITQPLLDAIYSADRTLTVSSTPTALPAAGQPLASSTYASKSRVAPELISNSGFDHVWLGSTNTIMVAESTTLATRASLTFDAQAFRVADGAAVSARAPYVSFGSSANPAIFGRNLDAAARGGTAALNLEGRNIDLVGTSTTQNIATLTITARDDVRLRGLTAGTARSSGALESGGDVLISAAQVTPATQTDFSLKVTRPGGRIAIEPSGATAIEPMSAAGSVTFESAHFINNGRVAAPHGAIAVNATDSITAGASAEFTVAGSQDILFGIVTNRSRWAYTNNPIDDSALIASPAGVNLLAKGIRLESASVDLAPGAKLNVSGGGELIAHEFVIGPGGSTNLALNFLPSPTAGPATRNSLFALIPARGDALAPFDPLTFADLHLNAATAGAAGFRFGETITIGAGSTIPAGTYTVLPPRYALLPGAFAAEPVAGYQDIASTRSISEAAGTVIVAGRRGFADAATEASRSSGYRVYTRDQFLSRGEFNEFRGSNFFAASATIAQQLAPRLPIDAAALTVAGDAVRLGADVAAAPLANGRGASIALTSSSVRVTDSASVLPAAPQPELVLNTSTLSSLAAESLVLGAAGESRDGTLALRRVASTTAITGTTPLTAGEVVLAARDRVSVGPGASIVSTASAVQTRQLSVNGDGAALYVGNSATVPALTRSGASAPGSAISGSLEVADNARLAGRSVLFDGTREQLFSSSAVVAASNLALSGASVNLGEIPLGTVGLNLSNELLRQFSSGGDTALTIRSAGAFNIYGAASIGELNADGTPVIKRLALDGAGFARITNSATGRGTTVTAGEISLSNERRSTASVSGTGSDAISFNALAATGSDGTPGTPGQIALGVGDIRFSGFSTVALQARPLASATGLTSGEIVATGNGSLNSAGALNLDAARITAATGTTYGFQAATTLTTIAAGSIAQPISQQLGASLDFSAGNVVHGGRVDVSAGRVSFRATGIGANAGVELLAGSSIRVAGTTQQFGSEQADVSAGSVTLSSANGSVVQQANSAIDISGSGTHGDAGRLSIAVLNGSVRLDGTVLTARSNAARGGEVDVDAGRLANLGDVVQAIDRGAVSAAGETKLESFGARIRNGNVSLAANDAIRARNITLAADGVDSVAAARTGQIEIAGALDASSPRAGRVELHALDTVRLAPTARVDASSSGAGETGGALFISSRVTSNAAVPAALDAIQIESGAQVNVSGGAPTIASTASDLGGQVTLRSRRQGNDVAIAALPTKYLQGARQEIVEGVVLSQHTGSLTLTPTGSATATNPLPALQTTLASYMSSPNRDAMTARLNRTGQADFRLRPGIEIQTLGDITLAAALDFSTGLQPGSNAGNFQWRYGGSTLATSEPGALTLRAGGAIRINQNLTDGVRQVGSAQTAFTQGDSWRYTLTAGADASAARAGAASQAGDLVLGSATAPAVIRTGTGRIELNAGRDIVLSSNRSVIYNSGVASVSAPVYGAPVPTLSPPMFTRFGGGVAMTAGRDINAQSSGTLVNDWLWRIGRGSEAQLNFEAAGNAPTSWYVALSQFESSTTAVGTTLIGGGGVGALGGGDVTVRAGNSINRLMANAPTNAFLVPVRDGAGSVTGYQLSERNGGTVDVVAGNRINGGLYFAQRGQIDVRATEIVSDTALNGLRIAQANNVARVQALREARFVTSFNPTLSAVSPRQYTPTEAASAISARNVSFSTYGPDTAFSVRSTAGDVVLEGAPAQSGTATAPGAGLATRNEDTASFQLAPSSIDLISFSGSVRINNNRLLYPDASGQLRILAESNVRSDSSAAVLAMSDQDPARLPNTLSPAPRPEVLALFGAGGLLGNNFLVDRTARHKVGEPLHAGDIRPVAIVARTGSLTGNLTLDLPKATHIIVGENIDRGARIRVQNVASTDVTKVHAGGAIDLSATQAGGEDNIALEVRGPGLAEVLAGGAVSLGASGGIVSRGNLANENLPVGGATLFIAAGLGRGTDGFVQRPSYRSVFERFVRYDAFAAAGSDAAALNRQVLEGKLSTAVREIIELGLADRASVDNPNSAFSTQLAALSERELIEGSGQLLTNVQRVANQRFVNSKNTDTFAAGYLIKGDLFPTTLSPAQGLRSFIAINPYAGAGNADALRLQALEGVPQPVADVIRIGLGDPRSVDQPNSPFNVALAKLDPAALESASRILLANTLRVGGAELDTLRSAGRVAAGVGTPFAAGFTDLAAAFVSDAPVGVNDISLVFSQIKAEQSGNLAVFAPQGGVLVGLANPPPGTIEKTPDKLGLLTFGGGDIVSVVRDNFDVFRSRVFTVAGGDVHLWSSLANIDAGRGPRDVAVAPPPRLAFDRDGAVTLDVTSTVTGSGIGALKTRDDQPRSDIRLIAPKGFIDAGEAGIRADSGTVTLGTNLVLNAGNIQAGGGVAGGAVTAPPPPPPPSGNLGGNAAERAQEEAKRQAADEQKEAEKRAARDKRTRVLGEFLGFGEGEKP